jgi:SAM-dependent methyltransferase
MSMRSAVKDRISNLLTRAQAQLGPREPQPKPATGSYEQLYDAHFEAVPPEHSIGDGDFDLIGRIMLGVLIHEGLQNDSTLVDLGCGVGRLARHAGPWLDDGRYVGTDVSQGMLNEARKCLGPLENVELVHQVGEEFPFLEAGQVDMICAFSVFTHIEHEDAFRYMQAAYRVVKPGGKFVFSCLPIDLDMSRSIFAIEAEAPFGDRWRRVRNIVTAQPIMDELAVMAGWKVHKWYRGDEANICLYDDAEGELRGLGQSTCVLVK